MTDRALAPRARIADIAAAAGVSAMTVSRALRGLEGVSPARRAEIERVAAAMNYIPDGNARTLASSRSSLIGISLPNLINDVFAEILQGMRDILRRAGFETVIDTTEYDDLQEQAWIARLMGWNPAAVIVTGVHHSETTCRWLRAASSPVMEIWDWTADPIDLCVGVDHEAAGAALGLFALRLGYRRPAFVGALKGYDPRSEARLRGIRRVFGAEAGLPVATARAGGVVSFQAGFGGTQTLLAQAGPHPDVIFYLSDHLAFGGMMALRAAGLAIPQDVGVVGFNALNLCAVLPQPLTTLRTPRARIGEVAARQIIARLNGARIERSVALPVELIAGATTRAHTP